MSRPSSSPKGSKPHITESVLSGKRVIPGIPPNPLPTWVNLPLEAKLPMIPAPKGGVVLYTTDMGEKIHQSSRDLGFDLTDPYSMCMSNDYKPLHDPHLKPHLQTPEMKKRLCRSGFITKDGKVLCTLREFNEYRQYLRKINLREEKEQQDAEQGTNNKVKSKRSSNSSSAIRKREEKVREIKKRLEQQHEEERNRYAKLLAEDEERRRRNREEQLARLSQKETSTRQQRDVRHASIKRQQMEERARKLEQMQRWYEDDRQRSLLAEKRRKIKEIERQKKLEQTWEERKKIQRMKLEQEARTRDQQEELKRKSILERERLLKKQQKRQQDILQQMSAYRRQEKERLADENARKFDEKMQKRRSRQKGRKRRQGAGQRAPSRRSPMKSVWDLEKSLNETFPPNAEHGKLGEFQFLQLVEEHLREQEEQREIQATLSHLGMDDFKGARFSYEVLHQLSSHKRPSADAKGKARLSQLGLQEFHGATFHIDTAESDEEEFEQEIYLSDEEDRALSPVATLGLGEFHGVKLSPSILDLVEKEKQRKRKLKVAFEEPKMCHRYYNPSNPEQDLQDAARSIVHVTMELATKVIYPAYMKYLEEDYPGLFAQYNRPASPEPSSEDHDGADDEDIDAYKSRGVRFSIIEESIPGGFLVTPDWDSSDWPLEEEDGQLSDQDEDEDPTLETRSSLMERVTGKDSVSRIHKNEQGQEGGDNLDLMLGQIMGMLTGGGLDSQQMRHLAVFAKQLIDAIEQRPVDSPAATPSSALSLASVPSAMVEPLRRRSTTSALADHVVEETLQALETELFAPPGGVQLAWDGTPPMSAASVSALADMLTSEAISRARNSLEELSSRGADVRSTSSEEAEKLVSSTLGRVSQEIQAQQAPVKRPKSMTSMLVMETINKVAMELSQEEDKEMNKTTSMIVQETLEKVAAQIQENNQRSSTSLFVQEVLEKVAGEIVDNPGEVQLNWDQQQPLKGREECTSQFSLLVRDTLSRVIHEIEAENKEMSPAMKSASSTFAEELVTDTLTKCLHEIKSGNMGREQVAAFVGATLHSAKTLKWQVKPKASSTSTKSLGILGRESRFKSTNSLLVEALVRETLVNVQKEIANGNMTPEEVTDLANTIEFNGEDEEGMALTTSESQEAESLVMEAIGNVLDDLGVESISFSGTNTTVGKSKSMEAGSTVSKKTSDTDAGQGGGSLHEVTGKKGNLEKISDAVLGVFKRSSRTASAGTPKTAESQLAESLVSAALQKNAEDLGETNAHVSFEKPKTAESQMAETIVSDTLQKSIDNIKEKNDLNQASVNLGSSDKTAAEDEMSEKDGTGIVSDTHIMAFDHDDESDSEPEMEIHPVLNGKEIHVDSHLVGEALMAFSSREVSKLKEPCDPVGRYSYRDLFHPDVARVSGLHAETQESLQHQLQTVSHRSVVLHSHLGPEELKEALAEDEEELDQEEEKHREEDALEEDLVKQESVEDVISVVDISSNQASQAQKQSEPASRTQSLATATDNKKSSTSKAVVKTASYSSKRTSGASLQQRNSALASTKLSASSSGLRQTYSGSVASRSSQSKRVSAVGSCASGTASKRSSKNTSVTKTGGNDSKVSVRSGGSKTLGRSTASMQKEVAVKTPSGGANDSQLSLLQQVANRLGTSSSDDVKKLNQDDAIPAPPHNSATQSSPMAAKSTSKSGTPSKDSQSKSEVAQSKSGASETSVKRKKSKGSGTVIESKGSKEKLGDENILTKKTSKEDTIKAYTSGTSSPKSSSKKASQTSVDKEDKRSVHSHEGITSNSETQSMGDVQEQEIKPNINNSSSSVGLRESQSESTKEVNVVKKSSSSRRRLPSSLVQVTQFPESFAPVDPELLSDKGSSTSLGSQKSDGSRQSLPTHTSDTQNLASSRRRFSLLEDSHSRASRGSLETAIKPSMSETRSPGMRRCSRDGGPDARPSIMSIPHKIDSHGVLREASLSATASTISAPELMGDPHSDISLNSQGKPEVPPEGTPV